MSFVLVHVDSFFIGYISPLFISLTTKFMTLFHSCTYSSSLKPHSIPLLHSHIPDLDIVTLFCDTVGLYSSMQFTDFYNFLKSFALLIFPRPIFWFTANTLFPAPKNLKKLKFLYGTNLSAAATTAVHYEMADSLAMKNESPSLKSREYNRAFVSNFTNINT